VYDRPREQAWRHWALAIAQAGKGNATAAAEEAKQMDAALKDYEAQVKKQPPVELTVARQELDGHVLAAQGKTDAAIKSLKHASEAQRKIRYSEPPQYPRPVNEALGEIALKAGKTHEAQTAFSTALEDLPNSSRSLKGLAASKGEHKATGAAVE
jgi:predicted negative regulator of RcsB-dependent stress response